MTSHEYAKKLHELAELLESRPEFKMPSYQKQYTADYGTGAFRYYTDKVGFLAAIRAIGSGRKDIGEDEVNFWDVKGLLRLEVDRNAVCHIVKPAQPAEYECEPLLSTEEETQVGA